MRSIDEYDEHSTTFHKEARVTDVHDIVILAKCDTPTAYGCDNSSQTIAKGPEQED